MTENGTHASSAQKSATAILLCLAGVRILLWLFTSGRYGYFRDELYYLACAEHLAWGYVDHPPFSIAALALVRATLGDSVHAIRLLPALATGALVVERLAQRPKWRALRPASITLLAVGGIGLAPLALPILSPGDLISFAETMGIEAPQEEILHTAELPQHFGDRFGWPEMVEEMARVVEGLSEEERASAVILAGNYGQAGALQFFGQAYSLPRVICGDNNYFLWGPGETNFEVVITIGFTEENLEAWFESIEEAGRTDCEFCMPYEDDRPIYVCRGLVAPIEEAWPTLKDFG